MLIEINVQAWLYNKSNLYSEVTLLFIGLRWIKISVIELSGPGLHFPYGCHKSVTTPIGQPAESLHGFHQLTHASDFYSVMKTWLVSIQFFPLLLATE